MTLLTFASLKGSPGVTTAAALTAARLPGSCLVELDCSGATLAVSFGDPELMASSGTVAMLSDPNLMNGGALDVNDYCMALPGGQQVVLGSRSAGATASALANRSADLGAGPAGALAKLLSGEDRSYVVDLGRLYPDSPAWPVGAGADVLVLVVENRLASVVIAAESLADAKNRGWVGDGRVSWLLVGERGGIRDTKGFEEETGHPVLATLAWDPTSASQFAEGKLGRRFKSSSLFKSTKPVANALALIADQQAVEQ